jgi:hypothetical protein
LAEAPWDLKRDTANQAALTGGAFSLALGLLALAAPLFIGALIVRYAVNVPVFDELEWVPLILGLHAGKLTFSELWAQHNDHRMFFPKLIVLGLATLGGWSQFRECVASLAIAVVGQLVLLRLLRSTFAPRTALFLFAGDSLLLFSPSQVENWLWGFQTAWLLINTCVLAVIVLDYRPTSRAWSFPVAVALAYVASFSSLTGLNVWPVGLIALSSSFRMRRGFVASWIAFGVAAAALYFHGYEYLGESPSGAFSQHTALGTLPLYFLAYLGGPLAAWAGVGWSVLFGALGVVGMFSATYAAYRPDFPEDFREKMIPWVALGVFPVLCAALTTLGRAGLGPEQALATRYITPATLLWIALFSAAATIAGALPRPRLQSVFRLTIVGCAGFYVCAFANGLGRMRESYRENLGVYRIATHPATATDQELQRIYPIPSIARSDLQELQDIGEGPAGRPDLPEGCPNLCR